MLVAACTRRPLFGNPEWSLALDGAWLLAYAGLLLAGTYGAVRGREPWLICAPEAPWAGELVADVVILQTLCGVEGGRSRGLCRDVIELALR